MILENLVYTLAGLLAGGGFLAFLAYGTKLTYDHEKAKSLLQREAEQREHVERMEMIKQGITPPADTRDVHGKLFGTLAGIGIAAVFFAATTGSSTAWLAAGAIGTAAVVGAVVVFLRKPAAPVSPNVLSESSIARTSSKPDERRGE